MRICEVYIYLLRLLSDTSVPFSLEQMADHFFCTERDIIRALKYWEKEKLLTLTYRNNEDIADIILNVPPVKSAAFRHTRFDSPCYKNRNPDFFCAGTACEADHQISHCTVS